MRGKALASILAAACCLGLTAGCSANTGGQPATQDPATENSEEQSKAQGAQREKAELDDYSPRAAIEGMAQAMVDGDYETVSRYLAVNADDELADESIQEGLVEPYFTDYSLSEGYVNDDGDPAFNLTFPPDDEEFEIDDFELIPDGGYRITHFPPLAIIDGTFDDMTCLSGQRNHYLIPGKYEVTCSTDTGATVKDTFYMGMEGENVESVE